MKKSLKICLMILFVCFLFIFSFACNNNNDISNTVELVGWEDGTDTAEFGEEYKLLEYVYDKDGKAYNVTADVTLQDDKEVTILNNSFVVADSRTHTIVYSTTAASKTITVKLDVTDRIDADFIITKDGNEGQELSKDQLMGFNISGDYEGTVRKYELNPNEKTTQEISFEYDYEQFKAKKSEGYQHLSFYIALQSQNQKAVRLLCSETANKDGLPLYQDYTNNLNEWKEIKMDIDVMQNLLFDTDGTRNEGVEIFSAYMAKEKRVNSDGSPTVMTILMTDIQFCENTKIHALAQDEISFVYNENSLNNFDLVATKPIGETFARANELNSLTGDYTGKAVKYVGTGTQYYELVITPRITENDWDNAVNNGYKEMYVWLAATIESSSTEGDLLFKTLNGTMTGHMCRTPIDLANKNTSGVWTRISIALDDANKEILFAKDGAKLVRLYSSKTAIQVTLYVGDCGFDGDSVLKEDEIVYVTSENSVSKFNATATTATGDNSISGTITRTYATESELSSLTDNYKGNAVKFTMSNALYYGLKITPKISEIEWDKVVKDGYKKMYVWVAATLPSGIDSNVLFKTLKGTEKGWMCSTGNINLATATTGGVWTKIEIDLTDANKALMFADGGANLVWFYRQNGTKDLQISLYVGDCGFDKDSIIEEDEIVYVTSENSLSKFNATATLSDGRDSTTAIVTKTLATKNELLSLTGDYDGKAVKFIISNNSYYGLKLLPKITTAEWDKAVADGYKKMYVWVAATLPNGIDSNVLFKTLNGSEKGYMCSTGNISLATATTGGVWTKIEIDLTDANKTLMFADGGANLVWFYRQNGTKDLQISLYVGDCGFDKESIVEEGEIAFVKDESSLTKFNAFTTTAIGANSTAGTVSKSLAKETELSTITGDYKGNAVKFTMSGNTYYGLKIAPRITEADWDKAVADGYKKMYVWVAATLPSGIDSNVLFKTLNGSEKGYMCSTGNVSLATATTGGVWTKIEIDLTDANKTLMFNDGGANLVWFYRQNGTKELEITLYVGDCGFDSNSKISG